MNAKVIIIKTLASRKLQSKSYEKLAEALLALQYDCKGCEGRGYTYQDNTHNEVNPCYYCKGTGLGSPVLKCNPASLSPAEKIQLLEEIGIDVDRWYTKIYYGNHVGKDLRQYIEEMK
jgi:hypothetical protein